MQKVILTLTTIPERLNIKSPYGFKSVIYSLINQDYENFEIHINIPNFNKKTNQEYTLPEWLKELDGQWFRRNVLRVFRTEDYGPVTKLYPTIKRINDLNQVIIVLDDDLIYHSGMIKEHLKLRNKDNEVVWAFAGINALENHKSFGIDRFVIGVNEDTRVSIIEHYKTVSYLRGMFDDDFNEEFISKGWADDELISAYMGMKKIKKYVAATDYIPKWNTEEEWRRYGVVESFPIINRCQGLSNNDGCNIFRVEGLPKIDNDISHYLKD